MSGTLVSIPIWIWPVKNAVITLLWRMRLLLYLWLLSHFNRHAGKSGHNLKIKRKICPIHCVTDPTDVTQQNTKTIIYYILWIVTLSSSMEIKLLVPNKIVFTRNLLLNFSLIQIAYKKVFLEKPGGLFAFPSLHPSWTARLQISYNT